MIKKLIAAIALSLLMTGNCLAEFWRFDLNAGSNSISGGLHYKTYLDTGYIRFGPSGVYADDDDTEYKWASFDLAVGSDTLRPGLNIDVGLRSIFGNTEDVGRSGDVGTIAFAAYTDYLFDKAVTVVPLEIFGGFSLSPEIMSFWDSKNYRELKLGLGIRIVKNASVQVAYTNYRLDMKSSTGDWTLNEDAFRAGIVMRF